MTFIFKSIGFLYLFVFVANISLAQSSTNSTPPNYWQQHVDYTMDIDMDVETYQYKGTQKLVYTNNSPDVLHRVFYHLYPNAFQPGSEMDARVQNIPDPDGRMAPNIGTRQNPVYESRIAKLKPNEIGYIKVGSLTQNGKNVAYETVGTILVVTLNEPIQPGEKTTFDMQFDAQVPIQIRRSGRNNKEGVALSMAQWYPKLAEYDTEGWHADPYIAREFYGVWGDFDVKITIDKNYVLGGTGYLQNPNEIGHGYNTQPVKTQKGNKLTWHFKAPNVHDFTWAADPEYKHDTLQMKNGPLLHFLYKSTMPKENLQIWKELQPKVAEFFTYYSSLVGKYPYDQYSVIQGGDGGMEYGMCTLTLGEGTFQGLVYGTLVHEVAHSWFQFVIATNELKHEWMDEGFATYIEYKAVDSLLNKQQTNPWERAYKTYIYMANSGYEQPESTHADHYAYNSVYSVASYYKGAVFLAQLGYVIGEENLDKTLKEYYKTWSFKHPKPLDFIRIAEKISRMELDWYLTEWTQTTNTIDYGVKSVENEGEKTKITLERIGEMGMPIDLEVEFTDGTKQQFYIPFRSTFGSKSTSATKLGDWAWAYPTYEFTIDRARPFIKSVTIDPKEFMADVNRENNKM
ncbi:MAG: M1 family metallopeptidase [Gelidibacter sp.]